ncbi:DinB family protein [Microbulbifer halophilus]|uniref:DinB family protein n=1 Tax=Microbulbifer halophilus TaxID=453963 RepID=A0ABW5EIR1_9GAMM|nr:DinB family protein [Microbulbifer halophilus]MCW8126951.1 DinB family protein [Microbulbifer halophilus]
MELQQHFKLLASYNQWINEKVYESACGLSEMEIQKDRGAFFGSILGTLNHIAVGDTIWLQRFATLPACRHSLREIAALPGPRSLDQIIYSDIEELRAHRQWLDNRIIEWIDGLSEPDFAQVLNYRTIKGISGSKRLSNLVLHFFNHQTHHRGQVSTLLMQAGKDIGVTDLLALIPDTEDPDHQ